MSKFPDNVQLGVEAFNELEDGEIFISGNVMCKKVGLKGKVIVHRAKKAKENDELEFRDEDLITHVRLTGQEDTQ